MGAIYPDLAGKVVIVTGGAGGIGEAITRAFIAQKARVGFLDIDVARGERLEAELGADARFVTCDLTHIPALKAAIQTVRDAFGPIDVLINNAGYSIPQSFAAVPWKAQKDFLMTLVVNACGLAHGVIPGMVERGGGRIIATASLAGFAPGVAGHTLYPGAKSLMMSFCQALDAEYRDKGLCVTAVSPGFVSTGFAAANGTDVVMAEAPRRLFLTPEQVVEAALKANDRRKVIVVPGWYNALAAALMRALPQGLVRWALRQGSAKYHLAAD